MLSARKLLLLSGSAVLAGWIALEAGLILTPFPRILEGAPPESVRFLDRTGKPLRRLLIADLSYTQRCRLREISANAIAATLSAEDKRFRAHSGIDLEATARALFDAVRRHTPQAGASTITQQLLKIANPGPRSLTRKIAEIWGALRLERSWSKDQILEEYLNRLEYGNLQVGLAAASRYYLGKPPSDLSVAEAAFLAGLPKAPSRLDPHAHFVEAQKRQRWVLGRMRANGWLDEARYQWAIAEPLQLLPPGQDFEAPHFVDLLLQRRGILPARGGPVRTTLDLALTREIEESANRQVAALADKHVSAAAVVVIDNPTGEVLVLCGSGDYFRPGTGQVNGAWIARSPGSAIKPFTYVCALERGAFPGTVVADVPTEFATATGVYRPNNYNHRFYGPVSLRFALGNSLNVAAVKILELAGGPERLARALRDAGITTLGHPADYYGLGLTLGNGEVRLLELTNAFAALARLGVYRPYHLLCHEHGETEPGRRIFDEHAAYLLADMLSDNQARAATFGLHSYLSFDFPVACKTGTSSNYRDNWTIGYTPEWTVGVWVGNPDGSPMRGITGVTGAAPIFREVVLHLRAKRGLSRYNIPDGIGRCRIDPLTGRKASADRLAAVEELFFFSPESARPTDYDDRGRVRLPADYSDWLHSAQNTLGDLISGVQCGSKLRILQPAPGSFYYLDPDLPATSQRLGLVAESEGPVEWSSPSLDCEPEDRRNSAVLREGRHIIRARDAITGQSASTWIEVQAW